MTGDAPCVTELRAAGALLVGKATLHELGIGMSGLNTHQARPPFDSDYEILPAFLT